MRKVQGWTMSGKPLDFNQSAIMSADFDYRQVAETYLYTPTGAETRVSTVFLVDTAASLSADPFDAQIVMPDDLFETMVFAGDHAVPDPGPFGIDFGYKRRYPTFDAALAGHVEHVDRLRGQGFRPALGS